MESDTLNKLILTAGLEGREISILRAYVRYMRQIRSPFGQPYIQSALTQHPKISGLLIDYFKSLFDPAVKNRNSDQLAAAANKELEKVESLD